ncbi:MAG: hypothetical protein ACMUIP_10780 [bacterium]
MKRKMKKTIQWFFFPVMIVCLCAGYVGASNHGRDLAGPSAWDAEISELKQTLNKRQSEKDKLVTKSDKLAKKIIREKQKSQGKSNRKLDSMLRESQELVTNIESVSKEIKRIEEHLEQRYSEAITALVAMLDAGIQQKKKKVVTQLITYIDAYEKIKEPIAMQIPEINLEITENDTDSEISQKADFLSDQAALLKAKMHQVDAHVTRLEREKALRGKAKKFADEINFFEDTLFIEEKKVSQPEAAVVLSAQDRETESATFSSPEVAGTSFIMQSESSGSSPSDLLLPASSIDNQIELLKRQRLQLEDQIQHLGKKMQIFYKRVEEFNSLKSP